jgi:integrase
MHAADRKLTVAAYLSGWLGDVRPNLKPRTWASYEEACRLYLTPGIGHIKLADLRDHHIRGLYASMRKINRPEAEEGSGDETLRRLLAARATVAQLPGRLIGTRPLSEAGIRRRHAVLVAAVTDAVERKLIPASPATAIKFKIRRTRPLVWTAVRSAQWAKDGLRPAPVMVWTRDQCGAFLDEAEVDRLFPLFHLVAHYGMRRQKLVNIRWSDLDLATRRIHIRGDVKVRGLR